MTDSTSGVMRPLGHLHALSKRYPSMSKHVGSFLEGRGQDLPDWPAWCFLPMAGWFAVVSAEAQVDRLPFGLIGDVQQLAAIGTWRYSQGIYRIDADLLAALVQSPVAGNLPSEVLCRLPEWSIYIETPGLHWGGDVLHGFWVHLEFDVNHQRAELRFLLDCENELIGFPLHLGNWSVTEAIERSVSEGVKQAKVNGLAGFGGVEVTHAVQELAPQTNMLVSIVLYLCSDAPEIDDAREPGVFPSQARPKKTKKGWRLFAADKARIWRVGHKIGEQLRQVSVSSSEPAGRTVKTHLRRGHWHGFWVGPRTGERKFTYKWISPLVVAAGDAE